MSWAELRENVAALGVETQQRLARGPDEDDETRCNLCRILKDDERPQAQALVRWHNVPESDHANREAMHARCLVVYALAEAARETARFDRLVSSGKGPQ